MKRNSVFFTAVSTKTRIGSDAAKVKRKGATRQIVAKGEKRYFSVLTYLLKLAAVGLVAGVITAGLVWFDPKSKLQSFSGKPISEVQLQGSFRFLDKMETTQLVSGLITDTFIDLDIAELKVSLEQNAWVDSVSISREWPDKLIVQVVEQQPIAQWSEKGFLNLRGDIIEVKKTTKIQSLPLLKGDDRFAKQILHQYLQMSKLLGAYEIGLISVTLDDTHAWQVVLDKNVTIKLGRDRILQKLQILADIKRNTLKDDFSKIDAVDMRYPNGFAVAWKDEFKEYMVGN